MGLITDPENFGLNRMTKKRIVDSCKKNKLYITPNLNDVLYLHFQGYQKIEDLEEYTALKCLWLESNAITEISGLDNQKILKCLFLHNNLIEKIENLEACRELDTINLSYNQVNHIDNCGSDILPVLNTLNLGNNYLRTAESIEILRNCHHLSVLDLSNNRLDDILVVKVFADMPELKVLVLTGNPVVNEIPSYRKTLIVECKKLTYLDTRPVFPRDRACAEAWKRGGFPEERRENIRWNKEERREMLRSVNVTLRMRNRGGGEPEVQLIPTDSSDDDEYYSREMRPKQCEEVSSTQQWNIMDEMMRNPEASDKYQSCKVCGSAFCKYQHIESHAVKDVDMSTEEIIESSNFSILWGDDNLGVFCGKNNTESVCQDLNKDAPNEKFGDDASCSYSNNRREENNATQIIKDSTDFSTKNPCSEECHANNTRIASSENENPNILPNITEVIKVSILPENCDSGDEDNNSIIEITDVARKKPLIIELVDPCNVEKIYNSDQYHVDNITINTSESPEVAANLVNDVESVEHENSQIIEVVDSCNVQKMSNSNQYHVGPTTINISESFEVEKNLVDDLELSVEHEKLQIIQVADSCNVEKINNSDQYHVDHTTNVYTTVNISESPKVAENLVDDLKISVEHENAQIMEVVDSCNVDKINNSDQYHIDPTTINISESSEEAENLVVDLELSVEHEITQIIEVVDSCNVEKINNSDQYHVDSTTHVDTTINISENPEVTENLVEDLEISVVHEIAQIIEVVDSCNVEKINKSHQYHVESTTHVDRTINISNSPEEAENLIHDFELSVENEKSHIIEVVDSCNVKKIINSDQYPLEHTNINISERFKVDKNLVNDLELTVEHKKPQIMEVADSCNLEKINNCTDQYLVDYTNINLSESPEMAENVTENKTIEVMCVDPRNENIETYLDTSLEYCLNMEEAIWSNKDEFNNEIENDFAEYNIHHPTMNVYTIEHESTKIIEHTFKSTDLSTLWEENSLAELDEDESKIDSHENGNTEAGEKLVEAIENIEENHLDGSIELYRVNVEEATFSYKAKSNDPKEEDDLNLVRNGNFTGEVVHSIEDVNVNHAVIATIENGNSEMLLNFECTIPNVQTANEYNADNLEAPMRCNLNNEFEIVNSKKISKRNSSRDNEFLISRIKKNCFEMNEMLESKVELNQTTSVTTMPDDQDEPEEFEDIDNCSRIDTLGYSTFVASFEQFFNEHELKSAELMKTVDFSGLYTEENKNSTVDSVTGEEKFAGNATNVDEIPAMKNFREYRAHLKSLLHRDSELRISCNELLNEINDKLEKIETIGKEPVADDVSVIELPISPNNSLLTPSNTFYKICYVDPNSSLDYVSIKNDIEGNILPDANLDAVEDDESHDI